MQSRRPSGPPLPSIRTLHPYLPPPSTIPAEPLPASTSSTALATSSPATLDRRRPSTDAGSDEYDHDGDHPPGEENDSESEQPRRKRRRQALSCTECKRRKIRCDRAQPCGPCSRRGDEAKCKWHVVELASEKYVPRSEYDALKKRVEALEDYLRQIPPPVLSTLSPFPGPTPLSAPPIPSLGPVPPNPYSGAAPALSPSSFPTLMSGSIQIPGSHGMGVIPGATAAHSYSYPPPVSTSSRYGAPGMAIPTTAPNPLGLPTPTGSALTQVSTTPIPTSSIVQAQRSRNPGHAHRPSAPEMGFVSASTPRPPARRRLSGYEHTYSGFPPPPIHPTPPPSSAARSSLSPIVSPTRTAASSTSAGMRAPSPAVPSRGQGSSRSGPRDDAGNGVELQRSGGLRHSFNATGSPVSPLRVLSLFAVSLDASGGAPVPVHAHCAMELREESMGGGTLAVTSVHLARRGRDWLPNSKAYSRIAFFPQHFLIERPVVAWQDCSGALAMPPRTSFALVGHFFMGIQSRHAMRKRRRRRNCRR